MNAGERGALPQDLLRARRRFQAWRGRRQRGRRTPDRLWELALQLAKKHGVSRTANALGLSYHGLKKRAGSPGRQAQSNSPAFIELPSPVVVGKQCLVELDNGAGAHMRLQLAGYAVAEVQALARSLWQAG